MTQTPLTTALKTNQLSLTTLQIHQLENYLSLLNKWNKTYNLTAITDPHEQIYKHIIDSLIASPMLHGTHCLDVGTGPGLPGIPLAIINPEKQFTLIDSNQKKTRFLVQAKASLQLKNIHVIHQRIEDYQPDILFTTIISRAFSSIEQFLTLSEHLVSNDGLWLAMKGQSPDQELNKISGDFLAKDVRQFSIEGLDAKRHIVTIKKR